MGGARRTWPVRRSAAQARQRRRWTFFSSLLKLTRDPQGMHRADAESLRAAGLSHVEIFEAAFVTAYYNYTNRVAEGLGVEPE